MVLKEYPDRNIPIYSELHDLIEAVRGELKTYNDNGGGQDDGGAFNANEGLWNVRHDGLHKIFFFLGSSFKKTVACD